MQKGAKLFRRCVGRHALRELARKKLVEMLFERSFIGRSGESAERKNQSEEEGESENAPSYFREIDHGELYDLRPARRPALDTAGQSG